MCGMFSNILLPAIAYPIWWVSRGLMSSHQSSLYTRIKQKLRRMNVQRGEWKYRISTSEAVLEIVLAKLVIKRIAKWNEDLGKIISSGITLRDHVLTHMGDTRWSVLYVASRGCHKSIVIISNYDAADCKHGKPYRTKTCTGTGMLAFDMPRTISVLAICCQMTVGARIAKL